MNKKILLSVLLIAVLALSSCGAAPQPPVIPPDAEIPVTVTLNEEFTAENGVKYTVVGARATTKTLFAPAATDPASAETVYFIVTVQLENKSNAIQTVNSLRNFELRDADGQAMKQVFDANNYNQPDYWEENSASDKKGINVNDKVKGEIAYSVPSNGKSFSFVVKDNDGKELFTAEIPMPPYFDENTPPSPAVPSPVASPAATASPEATPSPADSPAATEQTAATASAQA